MFSKQQKQGWKSGNTAVEFALIAPVMLTILAGIVDYGLQIHYQAELQTAVRAGAQYATGTGRATDVAGITSTIQNASDLTSIVVATPASVCRCSNGVLVACTGATCGDGSAVGAYLDLSATYSYTPLLSFYAPSRTLSFDRVPGRGVRAGDRLGHRRRWLPGVTQRRWPTAHQDYRSTA